jgi:hypothetical protein
MDHQAHRLFQFVGELTVFDGFARGGGILHQPKPALGIGCAGAVGIGIGMLQHQQFAIGKEGHAAHLDFPGLGP